MCTAGMCERPGSLAETTTCLAVPQEEISVDVVATSEISVSLTLDSARLWSRDLVVDELDALARRFDGIARVSVQSGVSIISLICDAARSSSILMKVSVCLIHINASSQPSIATVRGRNSRREVSPAYKQAWGAAQPAAIQHHHHVGSACNSRLLSRRTLQHVA